jgi:CheY-like chemotaxis protein
MAMCVGGGGRSGRGSDSHSFRPDMVILDLMLPGFDGLEICRRIHRDRQVPVIMLTARNSEKDRVVGLKVGADDYPPSRSPPHRSAGSPPLQACTV